MSLNTDELYNGTKSILFESVLKCMSTDDINCAGHLDCALLGWCS